MSSGGIFENKGAAQHYSNYLSKGRNRKKNPPAMNVGGPTSQVLRSVPRYSSAAAVRYQEPIDFRLPLQTSGMARQPLLQALFHSLCTFRNLPGPPSVALQHSQCRPLMLPRPVRSAPIFGESSKRGSSPFRKAQTKGSVGLSAFSGLWLQGRRALHDSSSNTCR